MRALLGRFERVLGLALGIVGAGFARTLETGAAHGALGKRGLCIAEVAGLFIREAAGLTGDVPKLLRGEAL